MPFKGCLSDACVLTKNERFVLNPSAKNRTLRFKTANLSICGLYFLMKIFPLYFPAGESALAKKMPGLEKVRERREKETTALVSH